MKHGREKMYKQIILKSEGIGTRLGMLMALPEIDTICMMNDGTDSQGLERSSACLMHGGTVF